MKNPLTLQVESKLGLGIIGIFSIFFVAIFFSIYNKAIDEMDAYSSSISGVNNLSKKQKNDIDLWITRNKINIPIQENRYLYVIDRYPNKPWRK